MCCITGAYTPASSPLVSSAGCLPRLVELGAKGAEQLKVCRGTSCCLPMHFCCLVQRLVTTAFALLVPCHHCAENEHGATWQYWRRRRGHSTVLLASPGYLTRSDLEICNTHSRAHSSFSHASKVSCRLHAAPQKGACMAQAPSRCGLWLRQPPCVLQQHNAAGPGRPGGWGRHHHHSTGGQAAVLCFTGLHAEGQRMGARVGAEEGYN